VGEAGPTEDGRQSQGGISSLETAPPQEAPPEPAPTGLSPAQEARATPEQKARAAKKAGKAKPPAAPVDQAAGQAATSSNNTLPEPTEAQKDAGNYQKGHTTIAGLNISIENAAGTKRRPEWGNLADHYGYIKGSIDNTGEQADVFIKPGTPKDYAGPVFVVTQNDPKTGKFDEFKSIIGYATPAEAEAAYRSNYTPDWKGFGGIQQMSLDEFKAGLADMTVQEKAQTQSRPQGGQTEEAGVSNVAPGEGSISPATATSLPQEPAQASQKEASQLVPAAKPPEQMTPEEYVEAKKPELEDVAVLEREFNDLPKDSNRRPRAERAIRSAREDNKAKEQRWKEDKGMWDRKHRRFIGDATEAQKPVSASAVDAYGIKLPEGYTREGDLYVYRPAPSPAPASQPAGQAEAEAADWTESDYQKSELLEREARRTDSPERLAEILKQSAGLPSEGRIANEVANRRIASDETFEAAAANVEANKMVQPTYWQAIRTKRQAQPAQPPRPATPEGRAEAALAEYEAEVRKALVGKPSKAAKDLAARKLDLAKRLRARLKAMAGAVDFDVYAKDLRAKSGELEVKPVGRKGSILFINPEKLINRLTAKHATTEAGREAMDVFILHEFIHKAAIGNMDGAKIIGLYNLLTPEAKAASKALYLADSGLTDFQQEGTAGKEFAAAHEWFAQLVEARLRGKISNQAEIEASQDPAFRDRLMALLRDFVAQLRDIAKLVTDKAEAARIEAEADAVQAIVADMATKAGLEIQTKDDKAAFYISEIRPTNRGQSIFEVGVDKDGDGRSERELRRSFRTLDEAMAYGESHGIRNATPKPWALIGNTHVTRKGDANITVQGKPGAYEVIDGAHTRKFQTLRDVRGYLDTHIFEGSDAYADQIAALPADEVAEMRVELEASDIFTLKAEAKKAGIELDKKATKPQVIDALMANAAQAKAGLEIQAGPEAAPQAAAKPASPDEALKVIDAAIRRYDERSRPYEGGQGIAVGAENANDRIAADALMSMKRAVRDGKDIDEALKIAIADAHEMVRNHNRKRPKDINWQRWEGTADSILTMTAANAKSAKPAASQPAPQAEPAQARQTDEADKALAEAFTGLFLPPSNQSSLRLPPQGSLEQTDLPRDRRDAMMKAASVLVDAGVKTPAELAARLDKLAPGGQLRQYSRAFWRLMTGFDSTLEEKPDWQAVYQASQAPVAGGPMGQAAAAATITKGQAEEVLKDSTLKDRPIKTYEMAVAANQVHMGTKISDWSAFPFTGEAQDGRPTQNLAGASEMQKAPTLFPNSNAQEHGNCEWCGKQPVKNFYFIKDDGKKWTLAVGSECITHFADKSGDEMAGEARQSLALATIQGITEARKTLSKEFSEIQPAGYGRTERVWRSPPARTLTDEAPDILGKITIESGAAAHSRWLNTKLEAAREWLARYAELMARPETKKRQIEWRARRIKEIETTLKLKNKPEWELASLEKKLEELRGEKAAMEGTTATPPPAVPTAADEIVARQRVEAARIKADDATAKREAAEATLAEAAPALPASVTPAQAEAVAEEVAMPYASPLAQFVGEWLGMNASQQSRVDMPQRVIRLAVNQADTEAVMQLVQDVGTKAADGQLLFNTPHQKIYNELREALRYTLRKGMGTEKDKVSTQLAALPDLTPPQTAAVAKEVAMPEPAKQAAPFDAAAAKGQKKFLLAEVAAAVKAAPKRADMTKEQKDTINDLEAQAARNWDSLSKEQREAYAGEHAATKADAERLIGYVTIEVPGDGTFTILNEKEALYRFQKKADKFPTTQARDDLPAKPTAQAPTAVPALKKAKTTADVVAAMFPMVSTDTTRGEGLQKVKGEGAYLWATNGRFAVRVEHENGGGKGQEAIVYDEKGNAQPWPEGEQNPTMEAIIPDDKAFTPYTLDTARWFSLMSQARAVIKDLPGETGTASKAVSLYRNPDGSLGSFASDVNRGDYAHNIQPEAQILAAYNPDYFQTILRVARNLGNEQIELRIQDDISPATLRAGNALFVLMPMRLNADTAPKATKPATPPPPTQAEPETPRPRIVGPHAITMNDVSDAYKLTDTEIDTAAAPVVDALKALATDITRLDKAGFPIRGGSVYTEAISGSKFTPAQLAAARIYAQRNNASSAIVDAIESAQGDWAARQAPPVTAEASPAAEPPAQPGQTREEVAEAARAFAAQDPSIPPPAPDDLETLQALRDRANHKPYKPDKLTPARLAVGIRAGWVTKTKEAKLTEKGSSQLSEWQQQQSAHDGALGALSDKLVDEAVSKWDRENDPTSWEAINAAKQAAAQPGQEAAPPAEPASIGQENVNAKHSREWSEVSTEGTMSNPRGTLRAAAIKSKTPSAPWYYQGDIRQLAFEQKAIVGGQSAATPEGAQTLKEYSAAVKDGWSYTNVKAGSYGTVYVFRKGDMVLTNAGAAALTDSTMKRPEDVPEGRGGSESNMTTRLAQYSARFVEWLQTLPESTLNSPVALSTKIRNDVLFKWVRIREPDQKPLEWRLTYLKEDGKADVQFFAPSLDELMKKAINFAVIERDMPFLERDRGYGYPEFKDAATVSEALAANGFAKPSQPAQAPAPEGQGGQVQPITGFDSARAFIAQLRKGEVTAEQVRTAWAQLKAQRPAILADLNKMKVDELLPMAGMSARKSDGKASIADSVLSTLDLYFNPDDSISYSYGGDFQTNKDNAMDEKVAKWTDEMIVEQAKARREAAEASKAAKEKALTNPETADEWDRFVWSTGRKAMSAEEVKEVLKLKSSQARNEAVRKKGESILTPEQLAAYDAVRGIDRKAQEQARTEAKSRVYGVNTGVEADIIETKHTQKGHDLFVVKLSERVERPVYDNLNAASKKLGGYYSSYSKGGAVPGFQFTSRAAAENFIAVSKGETVDQKEQIQERQEAKKSATASRLTAVADALDAKADGILNADRKTNTAKRAREAAGQEATARGMKAMAATMRNLAAAMESGEATHLDGVRMGTHVETLDGMARGAMSYWIRDRKMGMMEREKTEAGGPTAEMMDATRIPYPYLDKSTLMDLVAKGRETPGAKLLAERVAKIRMNENEGQAVTLRTDSELDDVKELAQKVTERGKPVWDTIKWKYETYDRLKAMGLTNLPSLRAALREFLQYRGQAAKEDPIKKMERELVGMKLPGFFPTPRAVIDEMVGIAGIEPGMKVLEPSAGKGDIAEAMQEAGAEVDAIELSSRLRDILTAKGVNVIDNDFTGVEPEPKYDAVVMNPPFENGQDIEHVEHAYKFLKPGGKLVAIMSAGPFYRQDKQATAFREWLDSVGGSHEAMPEGSFAGSDAFRQTGVRTEMVTITKPADEGQPAGLGLPPAGQAVTPAQDAEYLAAVAAGDLAKAQAMVDEAARKAGYDNPKVFRAETDDFDRYDMTIKKRGQSEEGVIFWTTNELVADSYMQDAKRKVSAYLKYNDPMVFDAGGSVKDRSFSKWVGWAQEDGNDAIVIRNVIDPLRLPWDKGNTGNELKGTLVGVFTPSQIKSADPVTRDESGEVIPLSERFNQQSNSILRNPPAPEGGPAASQEASQPEADEEADPDLAAFMAEQQRLAEEEAAAREALRNDPDAIDAMQASGKMSGRNLSKQFEYPEARAVYQALTAARDELGGPETVQLDKLRKWAKETFESDPEKYVQWAADMAEESKLLDVDEQAVLGQTFQFLTREARLTGDKNIRALLNKVGNYYLDTGTRLAQAMSARRDPLESPQERWTKALDIVFGPSEAVRRKLRILPTQAGKARRIASLEAQLAEVQGSRRADIEAALKTARAQETQEELLAKDDAESEKIKKAVLKNMGVTEDDLMLSGTDRVALQSAILDLPAVKEGLDAYKGKDNDGYNIMRLAFRGFSDEHIANALNLNQDDVGKFIHDATAAIIRPAVAAQVKAGTGFGGLIKAGFARLKKAVGLGLPPRQAGQAALDKEYMDAVEAGDMEKAQRMVDEAASRAAYGETVFHGTAAKEAFTVFKDYLPNFFTTSEEYATGYTGKGGGKGRVLKLFFKSSKPLDTRTPSGRKVFNEEFLPWVRAKGWQKDRFGEGAELPENELVDFTKADLLFPFLKHLQRSGDTRFDSYLVDERFGDYPPSFVPINPSQIKSADPVTRDESGQVIPLSERFNPASDSILRLPPKPIEAQPALLGGKRQTVADVTSEVNRVMAYALQSAKARNSGKLMSKVVMTPSGQRVRVFVPFDPDDMANYYAFAREYTAAKASAFDKVYEYWINWPLLSGPQTQVANITGNAAQVAWHYTGQRLAEATLNLAYQDPNAPQFREFKHILKGFWLGIGPAFEMARQTFLTEGDTIRHKYLGQPLEIDVVDGDLDKVGNIRASVGGQAGRISRLPGRVLRFTDAFFKTAIMYAEASAVAYRRAHVEAKRQGLKGQARAAFIDTEIANTLNDTSSAVWGDVMKTAEDLLFQGNNSATEFVDTVLGGYKGIKDLEKLLAEAEAKGDSDAVAELNKRIRARKFIGSLMRWIFPFQRTPTNIVRTGIKKAGGSAISLLYGLTRAGWLAMGKDGVPMIKSYPKAMQIKDASETLLAGLGWLALASMLEGDDNDDEKPVLLVGTRSHSLKERAATDQFLRKYGGENSIVWQDGKGKVLGSLPFGRYEPAATTLTTWIDAYRNYQEVKRLKSQGENASYSTYMLSSLVSSMEDKSFLQGFANAMQFVRDVEEKRENPDQSAGVKMLMNNVIPNLIKQPLRNMDDVLRERTTAGPGYAALPNPTIAPKLPVFAAQPKISTTGERLPKAFTPPARLLFQANTKVTPQPDALLYRANRLHPTKRWSPQPLQRDDYTADPPGKAKPVPITDPAKKRQFAELAGRLYAANAAKVTAKAMPSEKATPGESLIKAFKKAREDAMAAARAQAHAMGLHKATATP
jgi:hypothetical protein